MSVVVATDGGDRPARQLSKDRVAPEESRGEQGRVDQPRRDDGENDVSHRVHRAGSSTVRVAAGFVSASYPSVVASKS
jgi:hypothetical protein